MVNSYTPIQQLPTCEKMNKILFKLGLANFVLLILYLILDLMAWRSILIFPYVASWFWTPLSIRYWTSTTSDFDPVLSNNVFSIYNWSIIVLLGIIALNLIAVWKITQTSLPDNSQKWKTFCPLSLSYQIVFHLLASFGSCEKSPRAWKQNLSEYESIEDTSINLFKPVFGFAEKL